MMFVAGGVLWLNLSPFTAVNPNSTAHLYGWPIGVVAFAEGQGWVQTYFRDSLDSTARGAAYLQWKDLRLWRFAFFLLVDVSVLVSAVTFSGLVWQKCLTGRAKQQAGTGQ